MRSTFVVVYDACVLHPAVTRDLLYRLATTGFFQAKWSDRIITEAVRSVVARAAERGSPLTGEQADHLKDRMLYGVPDALVAGFEDLEGGIELPDPDDRHVVAAAVRAGAQVIVTDNIRDFPAGLLGPLGLEVVTPDGFVVNVMDLPGGVDAMLYVLEAQAAALKRPARSVVDIVDGLERAGLVEAVRRIRGLL